MCEQHILRVGGARIRMIFAAGAVEAGEGQTLNPKHIQDSNAPNPKEEKKKEMPFLFLNFRFIIYYLPAEYLDALHRG